jgi:dimethylglycine dehydrogenase
VPKPGRTALNYLCAPSGGIVTEMTLTNLGQERYWLISAAAGRACTTSTGCSSSCRARRARCGYENLSTRYGTLIVVGPRARELLALLTPARLDNEAFPWLSAFARSTSATPRRSRCASTMSANSAGSCTCPCEHLLSVYDLLSRRRAQGFGLADFGLYAMDSLRLEKCYRSWKADLTTEYTPLMASLDRFVKLDKPGGFIGQEALRREAARADRASASCRCSWNRGRCGCRRGIGGLSRR